MVEGEGGGGGGSTAGDDGFERRGGDLRGVSGCHGMTKCLAGFETCHFCRTDGEREYWITGMYRFGLCSNGVRIMDYGGISFGVNDVGIDAFGGFFKTRVRFLRFSFFFNLN